MTQYIELNSTLARYQPLSIEELNYNNIKELYDIEHLSTPQEIDEFILSELDKLLNELKETGFDLSYLEPLFIKQKMFKEHEVITKDTDLEIVSMYNQDFGSEAANQYAAMSIDFYYIERYLRTRRHGAFPVYSSIPKELFERHHSVDALIRHSDYYKSLAGINVRNFEAKFDAVMIETMKHYFHEARGINGIFAKVYFKVLDLRNIRIVLKGHLYGMEIKGIVRDVNG